MIHDSAVHFATKSRIHVALAVKNIANSILFYRSLFGQGPSKIRPGYAKFEVPEPPLNLALNETAGPTAPSNATAHYGIQVKSTGEVQALGASLAAAGLPITEEENRTCCYAVQNKVWVSDPDGNKWEVFVVVDDDAVRYQPTAEPCCDPSRCCVAAGSQ
jgi:catechol 2,3-dioxygenase-like lactoylglutathione lyase family enzyme